MTLEELQKMRAEWDACPVHEGPDVTPAFWLAETTLKLREAVREEFCREYDCSCCSVLDAVKELLEVPNETR